MGHHLPRPLIKSSAYPVQLPTCQQSHAPTTPTCQQSHAPTTTSRGHSSNHQHIQYNYPPANNLMPVQLPTCQQSHAPTTPTCQQSHAPTTTNHNFYRGTNNDGRRHHQQ